MKIEIYNSPNVSFFTVKNEKKWKKKCVYQTTLKFTVNKSCSRF